MTQDNATIKVTEIASNASVNNEEILMSLYATSQQTAAEIQKKITGGIVVWMPMDDTTWAAKMENPVSPATPMNV
jgi:hypothetical protein